MSLGAALFVLAVSAPAAPHLTASRTTHPPKIDGSLDEEAWRSASPSDRFTQYVPVDGARPSDRTELRVMYDDEAIYVGIRCEQRSSPILGHLTRRDADSESDAVSVLFDARGEGKDAFWMSVNVAGVLSDGTVHNQNVMSSEWDENWEAAVDVRATSWSAEFKIPLLALRFRATAPVQSWGMQVLRYIAERREVEQWAHVPRNNVNWVANYGRLDGLRDIRHRQAIELRPFGTLRTARQEPAGNIIARGYDTQPSVGLDLRLHLTESLTLDGTIAPDFTQVEADEVILNLSRYETFLPEKRTFFTEGVDLFVTPMQDPLAFGGTGEFPNRLFYSRRIGSAPALPALQVAPAVGTELSQPTAPSAVAFLQPATPSTIYGAAKLVGTTGSRWSVGALSALTARNDVPVENLITGVQGVRVADPMTLFNVLRIKRNLGAASQVGFIATAVSRFERDRPYPAADSATALCPSGITVQAGARCFHDAYVTGIDGVWRSDSGEYLLAAQLFGSITENGPPTAAADGTVVRSGDRGAGAWVRAAREGGQHLLLLAEYSGATQKLNYNDAGYMARANFQQTRLTAAYRTLQPGRLWLSTYAALSVMAQWNGRGLNLGRTYEATGQLQWRNFWNTALIIDAVPSHADDRELGTGVAFQRSAWTSAQLDVRSDPRQRVVVSASLRAVKLAPGRGGTVQLDLLYHALPQFDLEVIPLVTDAEGEYRFAPFGSLAGSYLFGRLDARSASLTLRAAYAFAPNVSLQAYGQLFVAAGHYADLASAPTSVAAGTTIDAGQLRPVAQVGVNPDFEQGALNVNLVLRWEYRLGSTFYLVYSRAQSPTVALEPGQTAELGVRSVLQSAAVDVILLKASLWWAK